MKIYYRISDNSYEKSKLFGANKNSCFNNFLNVFKNEDIIIIADKCKNETLEFLRLSNKETIETSFGNAGSLKFSIEHSIKNNQDDDVIYYCEDDYLHKENSAKLIQEGIRRSDYVTLYDHPDKYTPDYNGGEFSKVIKTDSSHWRYTISTCMTFGVKLKTIKEDLEIWSNHIGETHPHDHKIFTDLSKIKRRRLAVCIPGSSCHTDMEYSDRKKRVAIDEWAIDLMIKDLESKVGCNLDDFSNKFEKLSKLHELFSNL